MIQIENLPPSSDLHNTGNSIASKTVSRHLTPLEYLIAAPESINPAIFMCRKIQHLELTGELDYQKINDLSSEIETAINLGTEISSNVMATIVTLKNCRPATELIPEGF